MVFFSIFLEVTLNFNFQPLIELEKLMIDEKMAINVRVEEIWMREIQVLPNRTHPNMSMDGASGYILSAIKVLSWT
jgi:tRNA (adenine-N(1)-)-methyltransferase non-catalytic subunit